MINSDLKRLVSVGGIFERLNLLGLVWTDENLYVRRKYGKLAEAVKLNRHLSDSIIALAGLEEEIIKLADTNDKTIELAGVAIFDGTDESAKADFTIAWDHGRPGAVVLIYRSNAQSETQVELSRQLRARLMAETEKEQALQELARVNEDLEHFTVIISHDLKAPLRHMTYLVDEACHLCSNAETGAAIEKIQAIGEQARGMSSMLTSLFEYSTIGKKFDVMETFSLHDLVNEIVNQTPLNNFSVEIEDALPTITTLRAPLYLVLQNLISNAVQHHDRTTGNIKIRSEESRRNITVSVLDDGPGIDPRHHKSIFLPFRQIRSPDSKGNNPSGGMGLAMVAKIIAAAGGEIQVCSDPAQQRGTEVRFKWPRLTS